ncbi:MAG: GTP-binding protein, partial [Leifsonia sp.]
KKPPTVIMLAGLQGAGKTTLAGKLAKWLKKDGHTPMLVAADLQRPNAVTQLQVVGEQAGVEVYAPEPGNGVGNPVKVAKDAVKEAERRQFDTVIIDTAGRLGVDAEMMRQAADIRRATDPDEVLFVIDAMIGQDAVATAKAFQEGVDFTGVVLSKLDGDARGGAALSVASITGRPIIFASTGEGLDDFEPFHPDRMASRILDLGDILTLIEQAQSAFDEEEARQVAEKFATDSFTLDDFLKQMQQLRKMGSIKGMLGMLPGAGAMKQQLETFDEEEARKVAEKFATDTFTLDDFLGQMQQLRNMGSIKKMMGMLPGAGAMKQQLDNFDEKEIVRTEAIIQSMTKQERVNPKLLNGSRRLRIAKGSGMTVTDVNQLVIRFEQAAKMMKTVAKGGVPNVPGMGPIPGAGFSGGRGKQQQKKKGSKSGNPAKRAAENAAIASGAKPATDAAASGGSGFGLTGGKGAAPAAPSAEEMAALQKFLR